MTEPEDKGDLILEAETWKELVTSDNWRYFKELLRERRNYLNKQALLKLDNREDDFAFGYRLRAIECDAILQRVSDRLVELKTSNKGENDE
jgi:hypothetical protein